MIILPREPARPDTAAEIHTVVQSCTVLVAEDDFLIRMMAADELANAGFAVIEAANANDALSLLTVRASAIDAVFTDINMAGPPDPASAWDGLHLARHIGVCWPWIGLLVTSGRIRPAGVDMPPQSRFVPKPYSLHDVVAHIHALIGERHSRVSRTVPSLPHLS